jgi:hypothetical protein
MTRWQRELIRARNHVFAAVQEVGEEGLHSSQWLPLCTAFKHIEAAQAALAQARLQLISMRAIKDMQEGRGVKIEVKENGGYSIG